MEPTSQTLTARNPDDILAMVPVVLGFVPEDSLVMLTFGAPKARTFHARVDLPRGRRSLDETVEVLLEPVLRHRVRRVLLIAYTHDLAVAESVSRRVGSAMRDARVDVIGRLAADGERWWALPVGARDIGTAYDVSAHPFALQALVRGQVTHGSRADLAGTLAPDAAGVAAVERALEQQVDVTPARVAGEAAWASSLVRRHIVDRAVAAPDDLARLLVGLRDLTVRDAAWTTMTRGDTRGAVEFWSDVVRRSPREHLAAAAAILGFAAWLDGHGALAWCALDRSREGQPDYRLAGLLGEVLNAALPPSTWDELSRVRDHDLPA